MADGVKRTVVGLYEVYRPVNGDKTHYIDAPRGAEVLVHPEDVERFDRIQKELSAGPLSEEEFTRATDFGVQGAVSPPTAPAPAEPAKPEPPKGKGA